MIAASPRLPLAALVLGITGIAAIASLVLIFFNPILVLIFGPVAIALLGIALVSGLVTLWGASKALAVPILAGTIAVIDLGMTVGAPIFLLLKAIAYVAAAVIGIRALASSRLPRASLGAAFLIYALFAWATVFIANAPLGLMHTGLALFGLAGVAVAVERLETDDALRVVGWLALFIGTGCLISILLYVIAPQYVVATRVAGEGRAGGIFGSPNSFGAVASIGAIAAATALISRRVRVGPALLAAAMLGFCVVGLLLSGSRTALLAFVITVSLSAAMFWPRLALSAATFGTAAVFIIFVIGLEDDVLGLVEHLLSRGRNSFDVRTLTGRLPIWDFAYQSWLARPWFGYGLGESRRVISEGWANHWGGTTNSAHNLILESLLNVGLVGTVSLLLLVAVLVFRILRAFIGSAHDTAELRFLAMSLILYPLIQGFTEKSFGGTASASTGALVLALAYATLLTRARAK